MKRYQDKEIEKARKLREKEKYSFAHLQKITGIPATTIRNWCSEISIGSRWDTLLATNERKRQEIKHSELETINKINQIDSDFAKILASVIYWCEGSKYPSTNRVALTNSDPDLIKIFIDLLRKSFDLNESKFNVHLQIHEDQNYNKLKKFWSNLLNIPENYFLKPTVTKQNGGKHRKIYLGTCTLKYNDYKVQLKLIGIYEGFVNKFKEKINMEGWPSGLWRKS